jgi:predicted ATPase
MGCLVEVFFQPRETRNQVESLQTEAPGGWEFEDRGLGFGGVGWILGVKMAFIHSLETVPEHGDFPFTIPAIGALEEGLKLHPKVTYLVGENGSGKSTLMEGLADKWGFSHESGNRSKVFGTRDYDTELAQSLRLSRSSERPTDGFFLRAESLFNFATEMDDLEKEPYCADGYSMYGGKSLHERSHGESFLTIFLERFKGHGLYLLDEPEAALSPTRQMAFLVRLHDLVNDGSQLVIATHSPIVLAYPESVIYELGEEGVKEVKYEETQAVDVTRRFLRDPKGMVGRLLED